MKRYSPDTEEKRIGKYRAIKPTMLPDPSGEWFHEGDVGRLMVHNCHHPSCHCGTLNPDWVTAVRADVLIALENAFLAWRDLMKEYDDAKKVRGGYSDHEQALAAERQARKRAEAEVERLRDICQQLGWMEGEEGAPLYDQLNDRNARAAEVLEELTCPNATEAEALAILREGGGK